MYPVGVDIGHSVHNVNIVHNGHNGHSPLPPIWSKTVVFDPTTLPHCFSSVFEYQKPRSKSFAF